MFTVLASTEDAWTEASAGGARSTGRPSSRPSAAPRRPPVDLANRRRVRSTARSDQHADIDLDFYEMLQQRFKAPGDFAQAYVVAHEVGHHVQNLLGTMDKVQSQRQRMSVAAVQPVVGPVELQADCFAGDLGSPIRAGQGLARGSRGRTMAASQIGDDTMQKRTQGTVVPDAFTLMGPSKQLCTWFRDRHGKQGRPTADTFARAEP